MPANRWRAHKNGGIEFSEPMRHGAIFRIFHRIFGSVNNGNSWKGISLRDCGEVWSWQYLSIPHIHHSRYWTLFSGTKKSEITLLPKQKPKLTAMKTKKASEVYPQLLLSRKIKVLQKAVRKIQDLQTTNGISNMNLNQKPVQGNMLQLVPYILSSSTLWLGII